MALAFIFDSVGAGEWLLLLAVLLVVMGPKRLPGVLRKFGSQYAKFRRAADSFKRQLMEMDTEFERAVNSAEREFEEAAKIQDVTQPYDAAPEASSDDADPDSPSDDADPDSPSYDADPDSQPDGAAPEAPPAQSAEPTETDGDQATQ